MSEKENLRAELKRLEKSQSRCEREMRDLIRRNDELTMEIHNLRRVMERINVRIEVTRVEIEN